MPITLPPPTVFRQLRDVNDDVADRLGNLWRLATTDDQRWEIERLAEALAAADLDASEDPEIDDETMTADDWETLASDIQQAVDDAIACWRKS